MEEELLRFLDARRVLARYDQFDVGRTPRESTIAPEQGNAQHPPAPRLFDRGQHVAGLARAGNADQHVAGLTEGMDLPGKSIAEFVVVADRSEQAAIDTQGERGIGPAIAGKAADKLGCDMCRVGRAPAIAAKHQFAAGDQGGNDRIRGAPKWFFQSHKPIESGPRRIKGPPIVRHDRNLQNAEGAKIFMAKKHLEDGHIEARQFPHAHGRLTTAAKPSCIVLMFLRPGLFVAVLLLASCATPPKAVELVDAPVLPLALDGDFSFRKISRFLNQPELFQTTQNETINFERTRVNFGALSADERRRRQGTYFDFFWRANRPADLTVRLEYRQAKTGNAVRAQEVAYEQAQGSVKTSFAVIGDNYQWNGPVTAWRCLLIENKRIVAFTQSYLWK